MNIDKMKVAIVATGIVLTVANAFLVYTEVSALARCILIVVMGAGLCTIALMVYGDWKHRDEYIKDLRKQHAEVLASVRKREREEADRVQTARAFAGVASGTAWALVVDLMHLIEYLDRRESSAEVNAEKRRVKDKVASITINFLTRFPRLMHGDFVISTLSQSFCQGYVVGLWRDQLTKSVCGIRVLNAVAYKTGRDDLLPNKQYIRQLWRDQHKITGINPAPLGTYYPTR